MLVGPEDLAILDKQAHTSLHLAATILVGNGVTVQTVEHNDMAELHDAIEQAAARYDKVWYITDGLYSMMGISTHHRATADAR